MKEKIPTLMKEYGFEGIGVGFGGVLDTKRGASICSVHVPGWKDFPLKGWFEEEFSRPCTVVNDTVCGDMRSFFTEADGGKEFLCIPI